MNLEEIRKEIDGIDDAMSELFEKRMAMVLNVAKYKKENNLPIVNLEREKSILERVTKGQSRELATTTRAFFANIIALATTYEEMIIGQDSEAVELIKKALENTPKQFPKSATVACQGIEGANSQIAANSLFTEPDIKYVNSFEAVFQSVENGLCAYGILPIENNLHGSVIEVYDLMKKYEFYIAKSIKVKIKHALLAKQGVSLDEITEVFSHSQALNQCSDFLKSLKNVKITPFANTAMAAESAANSEREDIAAIADINCANLYNLTVVKSDIQNSDNNYTRFICISKNLQIYPEANKISLMLTIPHRPGSLGGIISKFSGLGVNLTKLESRPIPGKDFEFMFFIDFDADVKDDEVLGLLADLEHAADKLTFLGNYLESTTNA